MIRFAALSSLALALLAAAPTVHAAPSDAELARKVRGAITGAATGRLVSEESLTARTQGRSDLDLAREANTAITRALGSRVQGLVVSASDGVIELRGAVHDLASADAAVKLAKAVPGAHGVRSALGGETLLIPLGEPSERFSFATNKLLGGKGLRVEVEQGVVHLTGDVNGAAARRFVVSAARSVRGVRSVTDELVERDVSVETDAGLLGLLHYRMRKSVDLHHVYEDIDLQVRAGVVHVSGEVDEAWERDLVELTLLSTHAVMVVLSDVELVSGEAPAPRVAE